MTPDWLTRILLGTGCLAIVVGAPLLAAFGCSVR